MFWKGNWWGIELCAETEDDVKFLEEIDKRFNAKSHQSYDGGIKNISDVVHPSRHYDKRDENVLKVLTFER